MAAGLRDVPDWRDAAAYASLLDADRAFLAWEWLRRNAEYRAEVQACGSGRGEDEERARQWGLHAFEPFVLAVPDARPVWTAAADPFVLAVEAGPPTGRDDFDLARLARWSTVLPDTGHGEHLLLSDGLRAIRIDVLTGSLASEPAEIRYRLAGLRSAERAVLSLRRFLGLWGSGAFRPSLHPPETRARRWILMLRACDAIAAGATQREIASALLSAEAWQPRWRSEAPSLRSRAQRLVRSARAMESGGFWGLLGGDTVREGSREE